MLQKGIRQVDIANKLGVSRAAVCNVIKGYGASRRIKKAIADALGLTIEELWSGNDGHESSSRE